MFHLGSDKVASVLKKQYFWPSLQSDTRKYLSNCPDCELEKTRQMAAHGLFSARPFDAPRARWAMDFQGQGKARSGECEALALIDTTARYVIVLPLDDREASTFIQPFLDRLVFIHGPPDILHSDAAPEFLSEALQSASDRNYWHSYYYDPWPCSQCQWVCRNILAILEPLHEVVTRRPICTMAIICI
jgi:hypothetical protein